MAGLSGIGKFLGAGGGASKALGAIGGIGTALSIGSSLLGLIGANKQKKEGKRMLAGLKDPGHVIPPEYEKNLGEAENMARIGLPSEQYNLATTNIQRGTQLGLRQLGKMSNPFAGISSLARNQIDAFAGLDASNAAARRQNMLQAFAARRDMGGQKLAQQQYAQQGYADQYNQAMSMIGAGQQNKASSLGALGQFGLYSSIYGQKPNTIQNQPVVGAPLPSSSVLNNPGVRTTPYVPTTINYGQRQYAPYTGPFPNSGTGNLGMFGFPK